MATAEEIYEAIVQYEWNDVSASLKKSILSAINEARIEVIKECAEKVSVIGEWVTTDLGKEIQVFGTIDKQSILNLINQIK